MKKIIITTVVVTISIIVGYALLNMVHPVNSTESQTTSSDSPSNSSEQDNHTEENTTTTNSTKSNDQEDTEENGSDDSTTSNETGHTETFKVGNYTITMWIPDKFIKSEDKHAWSDVDVSFIAKLTYEIEPEIMYDYLPTESDIIMFSQVPVKISYDGKPTEGSPDAEFTEYKIESQKYYAIQYVLGDGSEGSFSGAGNYLIKLRDDLYVSISYLHGDKLKKYCSTTCPYENPECVEQENCEEFEEEWDYKYYFSKEDLLLAKKAIESIEIQDK